MIAWKIFFVVYNLASWIRPQLFAALDVLCHLHMEEGLYIQHYRILGVWFMRYWNDDTGNVTGSLLCIIIHMSAKHKQQHKRRNELMILFPRYYCSTMESYSSYIYRSPHCIGNSAPQEVSWERTKASNCLLNSELELSRAHILPACALHLQQFVLLMFDESCCSTHVDDWDRCTHII